MEVPPSPPAGTRSTNSKYTLSHTAIVSAFHISMYYIAIGLDSGAIHIFSLPALRRVHVLQQPGTIWSIVVCDVTHVLVAGGVGPELNVWDLATSEKRHSLAGHTNTVRCLALLPATRSEDDGSGGSRRALSASRDGTLRIWHLGTGMCERVLTGHEKTVRGLAVWGEESGEERAVSVSYDSDVRVWDVSPGEQEGDSCLFVLKGHTKNLFAVAVECELGKYEGVGGVEWGKGRRRIVTAGMDEEIRIWDGESGESLAVLRGHTGLVGHLIIVGDKVISSSIDGTVRIWSLNEYMELGCIHEHEGAITELAYDGTRVLSGGADGNVKVWKLDKGEPMRELVRGADAVWGGGFIGGKVVAVYRKSGSSVMEVFDCPIL